MLFKISIIILAICCIIFEVKAEGEKILDTYNQRYYPKTCKDFGNNNGSSIPFAVCYGNEKAESKKTCSVIRSNTNRLCNITIEAEYGGLINQKIDFVPLSIGDIERGVLVAIEQKPKSLEHIIRLIIVELGQDCRKKTANLIIHVDDIKYGSDTSVSKINVIPYKNSFDIIYNNSVQCKEKLCKANINFDGLIVNGPKAWISFENYGKDQSLTMDDTIVPIEYGFFEDSSYGLLLIKNFLSSDPFTLVSIIKENGEIQELKKIQVPYADGISSAFSIGDKIFDVCVAYQNKPNSYVIDCTQYDQEGNSKSEWSNVFDDLRIKVLSIYRLKNGGRLMATLQCLCPSFENCGKYDCYEDYISSNYVIYLKDESGKASGSVKLTCGSAPICYIYPESQYDEKENRLGSLKIENRSYCTLYGRNLKLYENDGNQYCVSLDCAPKPGQTFSRCYVKEDFH